MEEELTEEKKKEIEDCVKAVEDLWDKCPPKKETSELDDVFDFFILLLFGAVGMTSVISSSCMGSHSPAHSGSLPMACLDSFDSEAQIIP